MKSVKSTIEQRLKEELSPISLTIEDVSYQHAGHNQAAKAGSTHFNISLISEKFINVPRVKRHKMIYSALSDLMDNPIHALQLDLKSPNEATG